MYLCDFNRMEVKHEVSLRLMKDPGKFIDEFVCVVGRVCEREKTCKRANKRVNGSVSCVQCADHVGVHQKTSAPRCPASPRST